VSDFLGTLGEAFVLLRTDGSKLSEDMKKERAKIEKELDAMGSGLQSKGKMLTIGLTAPILAMGAAAVAVGLQFDDALDGIRITTGATGEALAGLEDSFKKVFADVPSTAEEVGQALGAIHQRTGLTGTALETMTTQVLTLARITKTDLNTTIQESVRLFAAWSVPTEQQGEKLDFLFKVSQRTGASMSDLMGGLTQFGPTLRAFNLGFEDSVVLLGQFEKAGMDSGMGMAALRKAAANFSKDGTDFNKGLEQTVQHIKDLGPGLKAQTLAIETFGSKAGTVVADAIFKGVFSLKEFRAEIEKTPESIVGAAQATDNFSEKLGKFQNKMTLALEPLGTKLLEVAERAMPMLEKLANVAIKVADSFGELPGPAQDTILVLGGLMAAAGPLVFVAGTLVSSWGKIAGTFGSTTTAVGGAAKAVPGLTGALGFLGPAIAVVATAWASWKVGEKIGEITGATDWIGKKLASALYGVSEAEYDASRAAAKSAETRKTSTTATEKQTKATEDQTEAQKKAAKAAEASIAAEERAKAAKEAATAAAKAYREELQKLADQYSGKDLIAQSEKFSLTLAKIGGAAKLTKDEAASMNKVFDETLTKLKLLGTTKGPE
jgi:phage-related minor tail protein